jgi:hypothetical protein
MGEILGLDTGTLAMPKINVTGFFSNTWVYILIIAIIGVIAIGIISLLLFKKTYKKKVVIFENIAGRGYQPVLKTSARVVKVANGGMEVLKTLAGRIYLDAHAKKMGMNTYWFAKGSDGYYYNILLGDLDNKMGMLDIEPVDRDVRMWHAGVERLKEDTYNKKGWFDEHSNQIISFVFLIVLVFGMWFIVGKIGDATTALASTAETNKQVLVSLQGVLENDIFKSKLSGVGGLIPATK